MIIQFARMMELVVISALKADGVYLREGSSPSSRISCADCAGIRNLCNNTYTGGLQ